MQRWIRKLFSSRQGGTTAARLKPRPKRRFSRPILEELETRLTPTTSTATQVFGGLTFTYTISSNSHLNPDGSLQSTLPVTVGITQPSGVTGQSNIPVLILEGGITETLGTTAGSGISPGSPGSQDTSKPGLLSFTSGANGPVSVPVTVIVTPTSMQSYIKPDANLVIDSGKSTEETVSVISRTATSFTATFVNPHNSGFTIDAFVPTSSTPTTTAIQAIAPTQLLTSGATHTFKAADLLGL